MGPVQSKLGPVVARRDLPRNIRRASLAARVGQRAEGKRALPGRTPTPAPVEVSLGVEALDPGAPSAFFDPRGTGSTVAWLAARAQARIPWLAFVAIAIALSFGLRRMDDLSIEIPTREAVIAAVDRGARAASGEIFERLERPGATQPAADAERRPFRRDGHVSIPGGILVFPSTFTPDPDGSFDLLIHFHGNTAVVRESAEAAKLDAAVAIVNLGVGSAPYEEYYAVPGTYEDLLDAARVGVERRGGLGAHVRRVALAGWSAGYGAISTILQVRKNEERLDAVLVFDGIHCGWENGELNPRQMKPFATLADQAARGLVYFGITHSEIDPRTYASTTATADYLLRATGTERTPLDARLDAPIYLELDSMKGAVSKRLEKRMEPTGEARRGSFRVVGYRGDTKEHHMAHLFQMAATLLPDLTARWSLGR